MELGITTVKAVATAIRTIDKEVGLDVSKRFALAVATHVIGVVLPVIDEVVDILVYALHLEIAGGVVHQQNAIERDVLALHQSTGRVSHQTLAYNGVHQGDILGRSAFVIPVHREVLVLAPREGAMVEDHVLTIGDATSIFVLGAYSTHAKAHIAYNDIIRTREADAIAIDGDALAWGCLACHIKVLGKRHARINTDDACHIEDNNAVGLTHSITQRTCA